jgi:DNA polymerase-3 subunit epsilon
LLDAQLLAEVYLAMTRGQDSLLMDSVSVSSLQIEVSTLDRVEIIVLRASADELHAHEQQLSAIDKATGGRCLWRAIN